MSDVSCRVFEFFERSARRLDVPPETFLEGTTLRLDDLRDPRRRVPWEEWVGLYHRLEELAGDLDTVRRLGRANLDTDFLGPLKRLAAGLATPAQVYALGARWAGPSLFRNIRFASQPLERGRLLFTMEIPDDQPGTEVVFAVVHGALERLPSVLGLGDAVVEARYSTHVGRFEILPPPADTLFDRLRRKAWAVVSVGVALGQLEQLQEEVLEGHQALARGERDFRAALEVLPDLVALLRDGRVQWVNRAWRRRLGHCRDQQVLDLVVPEDRERVAEYLLGTALGDVRLRLRGSDGDAIEAEAPPTTSVRYRGRDATLFVLRDVTARRRLERQLAVSDRLAAVGTLAAGVAHEVNNPLTWVLDRLERLEAGLADPGADREALARAAAEARTGAERVWGIVRDLSTFSRGDDDQLVAVEVEAVLEAMARMASSQVRYRAELSWDLAGVPRVLGSESRLGQVFMNLILNAAQAMPEGESGEVRLATRLVDGQVVVEVGDTGEGIPASQQERIFEPFYTTRRQGTGMGLAICRGVLEHVGGHIEVDSTPGVGSTFRVFLPVAPPDTDEPPRPASRPRVEQRARVLVIDDEPMVAEVLVGLLAGHEVVVAEGGAHALALFEDDRAFDVVFCDLMMPRMSGIDLYDRVRERHPELARRFAFVTGGTFTERARRFVTSCGRPTLAKPFDRRALLRVVDEALR